MCQAQYRAHWVWYLSLRRVVVFNSKNFLFWRERGRERRGKQKVTGIYNPNVKVLRTLSRDPPSLMT